MGLWNKPEIVTTPSFLASHTLPTHPQAKELKIVSVRQLSGGWYPPIPRGIAFPSHFPPIFTHFPYFLKGGGMFLGVGELKKICQEKIRTFHSPQSNAEGCTT